MKEYQFDKDRYYIGERENPDGILSYNCTFIAPVFVDGYWPRWNGAAWEQVENHKGEKVWIDGVETEITAYGPLPEGVSMTPPPPSLDEAKAAKLAEINQAKWAAIESGEVEYQGLRFATDTASQGLMGDATGMYQLAGILPPFWKAKDGVIDSPTIEQLTAIASAMYNFMEDQFVRERTLAATVNAAETVEDVEAVTWEEASTNG